LEASEEELFHLSERELEILKCLVDGMRYKLIADSCFIGIDTVNSHVKAIYKKLQVHSKDEAISKAIKKNIV
jgi:DNA-binding CsgD family transcriptional regulator